MQLHRRDAVLGLDPWYALADLSQPFRNLKHCVPDSSDVEHSTMFDDDEAFGLGGWGDPNYDVQITTGGFKDIVRVYPSPHHIRRNFTLRPLGAIPNPFANDPLAPPLDPTIMINGTLTPANYDFILNGFLGDFEGFHAYVEGPQVGD